MTQQYNYVQASFQCCMVKLLFQLAVMFCKLHKILTLPKSRLIQSGSITAIDKTVAT